MDARILRCLEVPEVDVVSSYAFSQDLRVLALCPNNEEVHIFQVTGEDFQRIDVLKKHTQRVTGLSFSSDNKLVSVSEDRTGFVWSNQGGAWITSNVELKASRAPLCVAWSPDSTRFAVGTSGKDVSICDWIEDASAWVAKKTGKYKAAVGTLAWHTSSAYLAAGSFDRSCNVYDVNPASETCGQSQVTESAASWINSVAFSETGQFFAFAANDSTVSFKDLQLGPDAAASRVRWRGLPFLCIAFVGDNCLLACGYDKLPILFRQGANGWQVSGSVDMAPKAAMNAGNKSQFEGAKNVFKGSSKQEKDSTKHTNTITACMAHGGGRFSTAGLDGQVVLWQLSG